jgi:hypothetical protein
MDKHYVTSDNAETIWDWLQNRGGIALWRSVDLSDPGKSWTTPAQEEDGSPKRKQHWKMEEQPHRIITDPAEVEVHVPKEVNRFHIAIRPGSNGLSLKVTDGSTRRIQKAVVKANREHCNDEDLAFYEFDYSTQEAVIFVPDRQLPIEEFINELRPPQPTGPRTSERERAGSTPEDHEGSGG